MTAIDEILTDRVIITTHLTRSETKLTRVGSIDQVGQIDQIEQILRFGAVESDEDLALSFTIYTQPLQVI